MFSTQFGHKQLIKLFNGFEELCYIINSDIQATMHKIRTLLIYDHTSV